MVPANDRSNIALWTDLAGGNLTDVQVQQLSRYLDLLIAANERMNLTRITDRRATEINHVGDALTLLRYLPEQTVHSRRSSDQS